MLVLVLLLVLALVNLSCHINDRECGKSGNWGQQKGEITAKFAAIQSIEMEVLKRKSNQESQWLLISTGFFNIADDLEAFLITRNYI